MYSFVGAYTTQGKGGGGDGRDGGGTVSAATNIGHKGNNRQHEGRQQSNSKAQLHIEEMGGRAFGGKGGGCVAARLAISSRRSHFFFFSSPTRAASFREPRRPLCLDGYRRQSTMTRRQ